MVADVLPRKTVAIHPASKMAVMAPLLEVLALVFPVRFAAYQKDTHPVDGLWSLESDTATAEQVFAAGQPVLHMPADCPDQARTHPWQVRVVGAPSVQPFMRGLSFEVAEGGMLWPLRPTERDVIIAVNEEGPLWTERREGKVNFRRAATGVPPLTTHKPALAQLLRGGWIRWLPLFHFLRELTAEIDWQPNGLRACFMFDDPNLHWSSWGFLDYQALTAHAREHRYHVSMATIPLDMWFTHSRTAALFREQSRYLSLLVHGVEHTHAELLRPQSPRHRLTDLQWSLKQVERLEARHGLRVSRVMAPPHHACSFEAADLLLQAGYEAACVAWLLLVRENPEVQWRPDFGLHFAEFLGRGFPILPRFNFAGQDPGRVVLAALFHQPIIMIGHHQDVAGGLDLLAHWARWVNSLGDVRWTNLEAMVHSNFLTRKTNGTLVVRLGARRIQFVVPEGVDQIFLLRPWIAAELAEPVCFIRKGTEIRLSAPTGSQVGPFKVSPGEQLTVLCEVPQHPQQAQLSTRSPGLRVWPLVRRLACEARDRLWPWVCPSPRSLVTRAPILD